MTKYKLHLILLPLAAADKLINAWIGEDCIGPPSAYFQLAASASTTMYPAVATYFASRIPFDKCGAKVSPYVDPKHCCVTSLEPDQTSFLSAAYFTADGDVGNSLPKAAISQRYCQIIPSDIGDNTALSGQSVLGILEGQNSSKIRCEPGGVMRIDPFSYFEDSNLTERYELSSNAKLLNSPYYGLITAQIYTVQVASIDSYVWKVYVPANLLVPNFRNGWEVVALLCCIATYSVMGLTAYAFTRKYIDKRDIMSLYNSCGLYIWLASLSLQTANAYGKWSQETLQKVEIASYVIQAFATYYTVIQNAIFVIGVSGYTNRVNYSIYTLLTALHLALAGSYYTYGFIVIYPDFLDAWTIWLDLFLWWALIMFVFMFTPGAMLIYNLVIRTNSSNKENEERNGGPSTRLKRLFRNDLIFSMTAVAFNTCMIVYPVINCIRRYFMVSFGSERIAVAFLMIRNLFFLIPFALHCQFLDHVSYIIKNTAQYEQHTLTVKMTLDDHVKSQTMISPSKNPIGGAKHCLFQ
jgi:hypothetical protein